MVDNLIAKTILEQLGGSRFCAMTGAKDFINTGDGLRFSFGRNKTSANRCFVQYDGGQDLYNVKFYRQSMSKQTFEIKCKTIKEYEGIYCDQLQEIFTEVTGMYTRLF